MLVSDFILSYLQKKKVKKVYFSINDPDVRSQNNCREILNKSKIVVNKGLLSSKANNFYNSYNHQLYKFSLNTLLGF